MTPTHLWPEKLCVQKPPCRSHTLTMRSAPAVATYLCAHARRTHADASEPRCLQHASELTGAGHLDTWAPHNRARTLPHTFPTLPPVGRNRFIHACTRPCPVFPLRTPPSLPWPLPQTAAAACSTPGTLDLAHNVCTQLLLMRKPSAACYPFPPETKNRFSTFSVTHPPDASIAMSATGALCARHVRRTCSPQCNRQHRRITAACSTRRWNAGCLKQ